MNAECLSADSIAALVKVTPGPQKRTLQAAALPGGGLQRVLDDKLDVLPWRPCTTTHCSAGSPTPVFLRIPHY